MQIYKQKLNYQIKNKKMKQIIINEVNAFESFKMTFGFPLSKNEIMVELKTDYKDYRNIYPQVMSQLITNKYYN